MKTPLLLLHGALNDHHQFDFLIPLLEEDFTVFTFDFLGHGHAGLAGEHLNTKSLVEQIAQFTQMHHLNQFYVFGYSMGAYMAYLYHQAHPGHVLKLYTLGTKIRWNEEVFNTEQRNLNSEVIKVKLPAFWDKLNQIHTALGAPKLIEETLVLLKELAAFNYLNENLLAAIEIPVHICVGEKDKTLSVDECEWATRIIKNARLEVLQDMPHSFEKLNMNALAHSMKQFFLERS
jgi:pimeloyl-ACP methyl ester carboxylesterase